MMAYTLTVLGIGVTLLLPVAAGGFIYITASDFIPALHARVAAPQWGQIVTFAIGIGLMQWLWSSNN